LPLTTHTSHYFPALYFAIIALCQVYDFIFTRFQSLGLAQRPIAGRSIAVLYLAVSIVAFTALAPLSYGGMWTQNECKRVKLLSTWDFDCNTFHSSYDQYVNVASVDSKIPISSAPVTPNKDAISSALAAPPQPQVVYQEPAPGRVPGAADPPVAPADPAGRHVVKQDVKVEYRDQKGRILSPEKAKEMKGKVKFQVNEILRILTQ
jgi:dolichyl-phosphate-mannose-protein mannosyltransferase